MREESTESSRGHNATHCRGARQRAVGNRAHNGNDRRQRHAKRRDSLGEVGGLVGRTPWSAAGPWPANVPAKMRVRAEGAPRGSWHPPPHYSRRSSLRCSRFSCLRCSCGGVRRGGAAAAGRSLRGGAAAGEAGAGGADAGTWRSVRTGGRGGGFTGTCAAGGRSLRGGATGAGATGAGALVALPGLTVR